MSEESQQNAYRGTHRERGHKRGGLARGGLFALLIAVLCVVAYLVASFVLHVLPTPALPGSSGLSHDTATIAVPKTPATLDIRSTNDRSTEQALLGNVYEGLTARDEKNAAVPGLASSWTVSSDARTYTFHLRDHLTFSDGSELTASDVVWSLQQIVTKKYPGSSELANLSGVTARDDATVVITLSAPSPNLLWALGGRGGLVYSRVTAQPGGSAAIPLGTGPFTVSAFAANKSVSLTRNAQYWGTAPKMAAITLRSFAGLGGSAKVTTALKNGTVQGAVGLSSAEYASAKKSSHLVAKTGETTAKTVLVYNANDNSLLSDKRVRQAARMLLNKKTLISSALGGLGTTLGGPVPALDPGYSDLTGVFGTDIAKGNAERAYFGGLFTNFKLAYSDASLKPVAENIVAQYKALGISVFAHQLSAAQWKKDVTGSMQYDMALFTQDASHDAGLWFSGTNWWTYDSPEADVTYKKALAATTEAGYTSKLKQAAATLVTDAPADWLYTEKVASAWSTTLSGTPTNMLNCYLPLWSLEKK
ncbi:MAG: ABC transporter substrate-binding protein [Bifidobacteriaceae bacterium]|jgi:peptide/nickel transport system substrate-binding protein|nr:ABC transporter substrate-binding protein [Bifidobacteriaceae bacterium]